MTWSRRSYPESLNLMVPTWFVCIRFCELVMFLPDKGHGPTQKHLVDYPISHRHAATVNLL